MDISVTSSTGSIDQTHVDDNDDTNKAMDFLNDHLHTEYVINDLHFSNEQILDTDNSPIEDIIDTEMLHIDQQVVGHIRLPAS